MKDKILLLVNLILFLTVLTLGGLLFTLVMLVIIPLAILSCMFSTNENRNESV